MPATVRPALIQGWDVNRPWHPRSGASLLRRRRQRQQQQPQKQQQDQDQDSQPQQQEL